MPPLVASSSPAPLLSSMSTLQEDDREQSATPDSYREAVPEDWAGWAELENDPAIFSTLLREWGVSGVEVQEMFELDSLLTKSPDEICGLIFLSQWTAPGEPDSNIKIPETLWFANQVSSYSCASVAIMNIINNRSDLDLGPALNTFCQHTQWKTPRARGEDLDSFDFVRNVHNSFATELDKLQVDHSLRDDAAKWQRKAQAAEKQPNANRRKRRRVTMAKKRKRIADDEDNYESENGFHFTAYAPCEGSLWKMDGLETNPQQLKLDETENWLFAAAGDLQNRMQEAQASNFNFSLMALVKTSGSVNSTVEVEDMKRTREDWGPFIERMVKIHADRGDLKGIMS